MVAAFEIVRDRFTESAPTTGELLIEGEHLCWTLELPWKENLVGESCIPPGVYDVILSWSTRFGRELPRLIGVPGRLGILLHPGNDEHNTEGCVLLGLRREADVIFDSRAAVERFLSWFTSVGNRATVTVR